MDVEVVGLGAWCEFVPGVESRASPGSVCFDVDEFAVLADGRRLTLHQGQRGFSLSGPKTSSQHPLADLTAEGIASGVLTTVLPDEDDGEQHPWTWLCDLLLAQGVVVAPDDLKALPYEVLLSERVQGLLRRQPPGAGASSGPTSPADGGAADRSDTTAGPGTPTTAQARRGS